MLKLCQIRNRSGDGRKNSLSNVKRTVYKAIVILEVKFAVYNSVILLKIFELHIELRVHKLYVKRLLEVKKNPRRS